MPGPYTLYRTRSLASDGRRKQGSCQLCWRESCHLGLLKNRWMAGRDQVSIQNLTTILHEAKPDSPYKSFVRPLVGTSSEVTTLCDYLTTLSVNVSP